MSQTDSETDLIPLNVQTLTTLLVLENSLSSPSSGEKHGIHNVIASLWSQGFPQIFCDDKEDIHLKYYILRKVLQLKCKCER